MQKFKVVHFLPPAANGVLLQSIACESSSLIVFLRCWDQALHCMLSQVELKGSLLCEPAQSLS